MEGTRGEAGRQVDGSEQPGSREQPRQQGPTPRGWQKAVRAGAHAQGQSQGAALLVSPAAFFLLPSYSNSLVKKCVNGKA